MVQASSLGIIPTLERRTQHDLKGKRQVRDITCLLGHWPSPVEQSYDRRLILEGTTTNSVTRPMKAPIATISTLYISSL